MDFIFIRPDRTKFILPLNPQAPELIVGGREVSYESISLGGFSAYRGKNPLHITWSGILPGRGFGRASFVKWDVDPYVVADTLRYMADSNERFQLIISGTFVSVFVYISEFKFVVGTGAGHIPYTIDLVEARTIYVKTDKEVGITGGVVPTSPTTGLGPSSGGEGRPGGTIPYTYTTVSGDTMGKIAQKFLGSSTKWSLIYDENVDQLASEEFLKAHPAFWPTSTSVIPTGTILRIPGGQTPAEDAAAGASPGD